MRLFASFKPQRDLLKNLLKQLFNINVLPFILFWKKSTNYTKQWKLFNGPVSISFKTIDNASEGFKTYQLCISLTYTSRTKSRPVTMWFNYDV